MLNGRSKIFSSSPVIDDSNIVQELFNALVIHQQNVADETELFDYRRGIQPILEKTKEIRKDINNKIVVNNADMVVTFKNGYFMTKPAFYKARSGNEEIIKKVQLLNDYLYNSGKQMEDNDVIDWFHTVGLGVLYVTPNRYDDGETPVKTYSLDPRTAFVVYSCDIGNNPLMGCHISVVDTIVYAEVYTRDMFYKYKVGTTINDIMSFFVIPTQIEFVEKKPNLLEAIPIIEYQYNKTRMSAFEVAIPIMNAINSVESDRQDGIEQFIQSLCVATNCDFEEGVTANTIREAGMISLRSAEGKVVDFKILSQSLDQNQTQTTLDDLYYQMLEKCGLPSTNRSGGSTSDNMGAVYLRDGWAIADTHARNCEDFFKKSNALFDEIFLKILKTTYRFDLKKNDFELQFPRNDMNNLQTKTQVALLMKQLGLAPEIALERSGLSNDPLNDVASSEPYISQAWQSEETK